MNDGLRALHLLAFFPVAYAVARCLFRRGLDLYGIVRVPGWHRNLGIGFLLGAGAWIVLFALYFGLGRYHYNGMNGGGQAALALAVVLFGYGVGSFISDMIVRGLLFSGLRNSLPPAAVFLAALVLYALDDVWYEGLQVQNTVFSLALGLSLTYAYARTNTVWASAGIHFGLNTVYGLFFGVSGRIGDGVFTFTETGNSSLLLTWLSTLLSLLLFVGVWLLRHQLAARREPLQLKQEPAARGRRTDTVSR